MAGRTRSIVGVVLLAVMWAPKASAAAGLPDESPVVRVRIVDDARVPRAVMEEALAETGRVYRAIGVELVWTSTEEPGVAPAFTIKLVRKSLGRTTAADRAFGIAPMDKNRRGRHAWVFFGRIQDRATVLRMSCGVLLGVVLAHEIGHLLLPGDSHSDVGLMRPTWDARHVQRAMWGLLNFTSNEAATIRSRLLDSASRPAN